jgi:5-formyltetrahydrofolate cyclo-ligase
MALSRRDALSVEERAAASAVICDAANALLAERVVPGAVVALYAAKGSEVDASRIDAAARSNGWLVVYPRVIETSRTLMFHAVTLDELAPTRFGLREPSADAAQVAVSEVAAFVVPGLAFDRAGGRIGWGRGYYDATFAAASPTALRVGLAYECQLIEQVTPEPHDVALHILITEATTYVVG